MDLIELSRLIDAVGGASPEKVMATRPLRLVELGEEWLADTRVTGLRGGTPKQYRLSLGLFDRAGVQTVGDVTPDKVRAFMRARLAAGRCAETANRNLAAISSLLTWLHAEGRVPLAQVLELRELYFPREVGPPPDFLAKPRYPELRMVARAIDRRFELLVAFGVESGVRYHEAAQLHSEDLALELDEPYVRVLRTADRENKTQRQRTTPICTAFAQELLALRLPPGPIFPARVRQGEALLSRYLHRGTFRTWREAALRTAFGRWTWHTLRHTFASWHVQANVSIAIVAAWLGNSVDVCERHYAALIPGGNKVAERAFADVPRPAASELARAV